MVSKVGTVALAGLAGFAGLAQAVPSSQHHPKSSQSCPSLNSSTFVIDEFQLYPENAKFDFNRCLVYFGVLFNASVGIFNPYTKDFEAILLPGISGDPANHLGPALPDAQGHLSILVDAGAAFNTAGQDVSGSNIIIKYDFDQRKVIWQRNITELITQGRWGGFQDVEHDKDENIYIVGTYPGTLLRVDKDGNNLKPWFLPPADELANTTVAGFGGIASIREQDVLLTNNNVDGQIYRFDNVSQSETGTPVLIPRTGPNGTQPSAPIGFNDAILLPAKYNNTVLLVAEDAVGVWVIRSKDGSWKSAETLGVVSNNVTEAQGGQVPAAVQIGPDALFTLEEYFTDPIVESTNAGSRSAFPIVGITAQVDDLLRKSP
ncbi:hypothetical protein N8I77_011939 [Diaporthe amygdali]|uniref:Tri14-like protein n=1 Tax=Phomopsis amygdali TaxID=1214568 RepID=A0AAD9S6P2_PHOAM|nr:hypothetical protein N8I77_011939 [Diaporthe amygdali]